MIKKTNLNQIHNEKRHLTRFENGVWNDAKRKYDITKWKCKIVLKTLKKFRFYLYEMRFVFEMNVNVLMAQFNMSNINFFDVLIIRWWWWYFLHRYATDLRSAHAGVLWILYTKKNFFQQKTLFLLIYARGCVVVESVSVCCLFYVNHVKFINCIIVAPLSKIKNIQFSLTTKLWFSAIFDHWLTVDNRSIFWC